MSNYLADFPPDKFGIFAYCNCGRQAKVDTSRLPQSLPMDTLHRKLRCQACGGREISMRIVWTAAGGYAHGG